MKASQLKKLIREEVRKVLKEQADPNATYVAYIGASRGEFDPELFKKVSGNVSTVAKAVLKKATNDVDDPEFAEEFIRGFKLDEDTYYILTGEETVAVVGKPKSKKYGEFWSMLVNDDLDGAGEIFDQMDIDSGNASELEEVRKALKEAKAMSLGLPYPPRGGKIAAAFITVANKLGMKQSPYANKAGAGVAGDYGFIFEPMDGADGELVVIENGEGVGNKKGNTPSAIVINNPKMQANPKIKELAKKCIKQYDESKSLKEATGKAFALVIDEDGNFLQQDLSSYFEEAGGYEEPTKLAAAKVAKFPTEYDAWANAPELAKAENAKWVKAVAALSSTSDFYDVLGDGGENAFIAAVPKGSDVEDYMGEM